MIGWTYFKNFKLNAILVRGTLVFTCTVLMACSGDKKSNATGSKEVDVKVHDVHIFGSSTMKIAQGTRFVDFGAMPVDKTGKRIEEIPVTAEGEVDINTIGTYHINYLVETSPGNTTKKTRTVHVVDIKEVAKIEHFASPAGGDYLILTYSSIYDIHSPNFFPDSEDPEFALRVNWGSFDSESIVAYMENYLDVHEFDFILMYSISKLPGWIHAGNSCFTPAKNIGFNNYLVNDSNRCGFPDTSKIRSTPHMNSIRYSEDLSWNAVIAVHEIGHFWSSYWSENVEVWKEGDSLATLAGGYGHWTYLWYEEGMPGIMRSGANSNKFNAFDLYAVGLMPYEEVRHYNYLLYEIDNKSKLHTIRVDHLIDNLKSRGIDYYFGDGKRVPDTDASVNNLKTLIVLIKGEDEEMTDEDIGQLEHISTELPRVWNTATWGRSSMNTDIILNEVK